MLSIDNILASRDKSKKYIFKLKDDTKVESVYIPQENEIMICLSSQVGCSNKCRHCATGQLIYKRDLSMLEIVGQLLTILAKESLDKELRILFMGMGEPLMNFQNTFDAIDYMVEQGYATYNNITLSTSGIVNKFNEIANRKRRPQLAISLHAATDAKRSLLMPINKIFNLSMLMKAIDEYIKMTSDNIIIEYTLIRDFNDTHADYVNLDALLNNIKSNIEIQLIPLNESEYIPFKQSDNVDDFYNYLSSNGYSVFLKPSSGVDVKGGCGQLIAGLEN